MRRLAVYLAAIAVLAGCGHSQTTKAGLMSFGELEGKVIPESGSTLKYSGESCGETQHLSDAVRDALKGTEFDTLINGEITSETGLFVWNNCLVVSGYALNSNALAKKGTN